MNHDLELFKARLLERPCCRSRDIAHEILTYAEMLHTEVQKLSNRLKSEPPKAAVLRTQELSKTATPKETTNVPTQSGAVSSIG